LNLKHHYFPNNNLINEKPEINFINLYYSFNYFKYYNLSPIHSLYSNYPLYFSLTIIYKLIFLISPETKLHYYSKYLSILLVYLILKELKHSLFILSDNLFNKKKKQKIIKKNYFFFLIFIKKLFYFSLKLKYSCINDICWLKYK
jgi:hypothetical protein